MRLLDVHTDGRGKSLTWRLLNERPFEANISHQSAVSYAEHERFFDSRPYQYWFLIEEEIDGQDLAVGAVYLTKQNEIGIAILKDYQRRGYGRLALQLFIEIWNPLPGIPSIRSGSFVANIAPGNEISTQLFEGLGFRHVQNTYRLEAKKGER